MGTAAAVWGMYNSGNIHDGSSTTNIATSTGGVLDANHTFITPNFGVKTTTSTSPRSPCRAIRSIEMEFDIDALTSSTPGATYCFRLTNNGATNTFPIPKNPEATVAGGQRFSAYHEQPDRHPAGAHSRTAVSATTTATVHVTGATLGYTLSAEEPGEAAAPATSQNTDRQGLAVRWNAELPVRATEPAPIRAMHGTGSGVIPVEKWLEPGFWDRDTNQEEEIEVVEPEQPIHANLIEFPRELVATRKVRPRRAEGPYATAEEPAGQLSIFEVDPGSISTQPAAADVAAEAAWTGPEWSGMQLDEEPRQEAAYPADNAENAATEADAATEPAAAPVQAAPINLRLMAAVVDGALITGAFLVAALVAAMNAKDMPSIHAAELIAAAGLTAIGRALPGALPARWPRPRRE